MKENKKVNNREKNYIYKVLPTIIILNAVILSVVMLIFVSTQRNIQSYNRNSLGYVRVDNYGIAEEYDSNTPIGIKKIYSFIIDDEVAVDSYLAFYTVHQYVDVWIDGEHIYSLKPSGVYEFCKTVGSNWTMIPIFGDEVGKEVIVEITPVYESFRDRTVEFLIGSELAIYRDRLSKDLPQLILSVMAIFIGLVFVVVAGYSQLRKKHVKGMIYLGVFSVMMGVWRITDTRFTPFIFPKHSVMMFYLSVIMLMLGMIPLIKFIEEYYSEKSKRIMDGYCIFSAIIAMIQILLQFAGVADLREMLIITHIVIAAGVLMSIGTAVYERITYPDRVKNIVGNKLPYICVAGVVADVVAFYIKGNSSGLMFSLLGFLLYIVILGIATLFNYSEQELKLAEQERELAEKDRKLMERRITSMMSQIRSHFIFNVLTTISGYCKLDPKKADDALIRFSRYLRKNIQIIEEEGLIDFDKELEQLEDYVALEQLRYENMIEFEKEIKTSSFRLPPLTIQPIVENSIKHGLVGQNKCGVIRLCTDRRDGQIEITVSDNGVGFEPDECEKPDSVGLKNVRYRLENMMGGTLDIDSKPGAGTTVVVRFPAQ